MIHKALLCLIYIIIFCTPVRPQESLKYTVSVDMHIAPIYAVDNKGKPVFDIKKEEIDLQVNGKAIEFQLLHYDFSMGRKNDTVEKTFKDINSKENRNNRVIFLVFDAMYNSQIGIGRAKRMAKSLINNSTPGNYFILMENTKSRGLRYIVGPETDKGKLNKHISQITDFPEKYRRNLFSIQGYDAASDRIMENDPEGIKTLQISHIRLEQKRYINSIKSFSQSLANLKYILKSIDLPKSVILFSEGIANGAFKEKENKRKMLLFKMLRHSVQSITRTGTMVYTVNPQLRDPFTEQVGPMDSGEKSLRFIANEGGGEYFSSPTKEAMVENLNNSISAYYELAFPQEIKMGENKNIKIICKRRGVKISTLSRIVGKKTYLELDKVEKKMYALNIVFNSRWLSQMEEVTEAEYRSSEVKQKNGSTINILDIKIPEKMQKRKADIFLVQVGEDMQKSEIKRFSRILKPLETLEISIAEEKRNFFVIVDQVSSASIFGNGDWRLKNWKTPSLTKLTNKKIFIINTSDLMDTLAGILSISSGDEGHYIKLNGAIIHREQASILFHRIYKDNFNDIVLLKISKKKDGISKSGFMLIMLGSNGKYLISSIFPKEPGQVIAGKEKMLVESQPVNVVKRGQTSAFQKDFYYFFHQFKNDEQFQLSHTVFPFERQRFDPVSGELLAIKKIQESEWEFTPFENTPSYFWSEPEVTQNQAIIYLSGDQVKIALIFEKKDGQWNLLRSENKSKQ